MSRSHDPEHRHLVVIRHAKSSWDDPSLTDHDRPLSKRGRDSLKRLRDHIASLGLRPDVVLCSTSQRTRETLDGIRTTLGRRARVELDAKLYGASSGHLISELRRLDDQARTVFLIGHNPGVEDLVDLLVPDAARGGMAIEKFPTAAVAVLTVSGPWSALQPGHASLDSFWTPRPPNLPNRT